jgi:hypothetical protein
MNITVKQWFYTIIELDVVQEKDLQHQGTS